MTPLTAPVTILKDSAAILAAGDSVGGKASSLAQTLARGLPVPAFGVVLPNSELDKTEVELAVRDFIKTFFPSVAYFAVRSSARREDGVAFSFAGMYESFLYITPEAVAEAVRNVWASARSERLSAYCQEQGLSIEHELPAVIIQEMIPSEKSGIAFGADPATGHRELVTMSAVLGLGSGVVSGECESDTYHVTHQLDVVRSSVPRKQVYYQLDANATPPTIMRQTVPLAAQNQPVLRLDEICAVTRLACQTGEIFGAPQDIEWAFAKGRLYLLQSRPITQLPPAPPAEAACWHAWDGTQTMENWPEFNTPLTCDLAKHILATTYRIQIFETGILKLPKADYAGFFEGLIGVVNSRIYLDSKVLEDLWHHAPSVLYRMTDCIEDTKTLLKTPDMDTVDFVDWRNRWGQALSGVFNLLKVYAFLPDRMRKFYRDTDRILDTPDPTTLNGHYQRVTGILDLIAERWHAPVLNTFFAETLLYVLNANGLTLHDVPMTKTLSQTFMNDLTQLSDQVSAVPALAEAFKTATLPEIDTQLSTHTVLQKAIHDFLSCYGDRGNGDMKLEGKSWRDDPLPLFRIMGTPGSRSAREQSEKPKSPRLSWFARGLLRQYETRLYHREIMRLQVTRLIGRMRRAVNALGDLLSQQGVLALPDDILFLRFSEIDALVKNTADSSTLKTLQESIRQRRADYATHRALPALPDQWHTWGNLPPEPPVLTQDLSTVMALYGQPCAPGEVTADVVWYAPDKDPASYQGKILAVSQGDPALVTVYPLIRGLLLARGSLLSHPAIVARELGVPTIVGLTALAEWLSEGDIVRMNGNAGSVIRCP